jgi:hypothetical protein
VRSVPPVATPLPVLYCESSGAESGIAHETLAGYGTH